MSRIVIIGGGIAGLASAGLLAKQGHEVTVLEAQPEIGGRAGSWEHEGFRFDTGPSWYLMPEVFDHFYELMGTSADEQLALITLDPGYRVYFEGRPDPLDISAELTENLALFESIEKGAGKRLEKYLDSARETYEIAKRRFLYTTFADFRPLLTRDVLAQAGRFVRLLLEPLSKMIGRRFRDIRLRQVLGYPAVFLGSSPFLTPSMYHLMSHLDLADGVLYPVGGFTRVIHSIADVAVDHGAVIHTGARATRIVVSGGVATGVEYTDGAGMPQLLPADIVVSAADLHFTETQLLKEDERTYPQKYWDRSMPGPSALLLYLGVKGELPQLEHHTLLFTREWKRGFDAIFSEPATIPQPASLYVCKPGGVDPDVAPDGYENLFVLVPIPADPLIGSGGIDGTGDERIEALADTVIAQIAEWTGVDDLASRITVRRTLGPGDFARDLNAWRGTALGPAHILKQSAFFRAGNISRKVRGLYYVGGSTIPGIGLPMCLISAEILVKRLVGDTSTGPLHELPALPPSSAGTVRAAKTVTAPPAAAETAPVPPAAAQTAAAPPAAAQPAPGPPA